jgi:hypothetical protein
MVVDGGDDLSDAEELIKVDFATPGNRDVHPDTVLLSRDKEQLLVIVRIKKVRLIRHLVLECVQSFYFFSVEMKFEDAVLTGEDH